MPSLPSRLRLAFIRLCSQAGQAVVETVLAIPILIALFAACLQMLHLGIAHIIVELAAFEATRQATLANMNINDARSTAEDICKVLGPGQTEVKYMDNPPGYTIIHHLRTIVPIVRELKVEHSFPSYVFLPGYDLVPGSATSPSQGGGGGNSGSPPNYNPGGSGGGSHMEVADYDSNDYSDGSSTAPNGNNGATSANANPSMNPIYLSSVNPQTLPQGLEPYHSPPGADYSESMDDAYSDYSADSSSSYEPSDTELPVDSSSTNTDENTTNLNGASGATVAGGSSRTAGDYLAAGVNAVGRSIWPMPLIPTDTIAEAGKRASNKTDEIDEDEQTATAVAEQDQKEHQNGLLALASGAKDGYLGPSQRRENELPNVKFANETEEAYKKKSKKYQDSLDEMDKEADKEKGLKKAVKKAKIKTTKAAAAGSDILVEAVLDIPKVGQDLPEAVENTKAIGKNLKEKKYKEALYSAGKAAGLGLKEVDRLNPLKGVAQGIGKKLVKQGSKEIVEQAEKRLVKRNEKKYYRYVNEDEANKIKKTGKIPNKTIEDKQKKVYITDKKYETSGRAKTHLQLPQKPSYRVEIDPKKVKNKTNLRKINSDENPQWGKGGGTEATTNEAIEVDTSKIKKLKGAK